MKRRYFSIFLVLVGIVVLTSALGGCSKNAGYFDEYLKQRSFDDISQYIKLADYKGLEYEKYENQVSQDQVEYYIYQLLEYYATSEKQTSGVVDENTIVNIDYSGYLDGIQFDGGTASGAELNIADNNFIDGFAESIIGHSVGENFDINVTFPEDYGNPDLAGQDAVFNITINYIITKKVPEYNDEWVKSNTDFSSKSELEESVKQDLLKQDNAESADEVKSSLFGQIADSSEVIEYPEEMYQEIYDEYVSSYKDYAENNDLEFADYLSEEMGMTEEEFNELAENIAQDEAKKELVLFAILDSEGLSPSSDGFDDFLITLLEEAGYTEESYKEAYGYTIQEYAEENNFGLSYIYRIVMDKVMEYSVAK